MNTYALETRQTSNSITAIAIGGGAFLALFLAYGVSAAPKQAAVVFAGFCAIAFYAVLSLWKGAMETVTLFALAGTLAVSIKFHLIFRADHIGGAIGYRISITEIFAALLLFVMWIEKNERSSWKLSIDRPITLAFGAYFICATAATLAAKDVELGMFELSALVQAYLLFLLLSNILTTKRRAIVFATGLLFGLLLQSGVAALQNKYPGRFNLEFAGGRNDTDKVNSNGGIDLPQMDNGTTVVEGAIAHRPTGLLIHPNVLGLYLTLTVPIALAMSIGSSSKRVRLIGAASLALGSIALYLSLSRSAWAGTFLALLICALLGYRLRVRVGWKARVVLALAALLLVGFVSVKSAKIMNRITGTAGEAVDFRLILDHAAIQMIEDHPALGVGLNNFTGFIEPYDHSGMSHYVRFPVHMLYLLEASETGIPGGIAFFIFVCVTCIHGYSLTKNIRIPEFKLLGAFLLAGLVGFWFAESTGFVYRIPVMTSYVWCSLGLLCALPKIDLGETI